MQVRDNSVQQQQVSLKQLDFKKQKSYRFTISNQMMKRAPTKYLKTMKSIKSHTKQAASKSLKNFQAYERNEDNSSDSSDCNNVDENINLQENNRAVPNLSFKDGFIFSLDHQEQQTHNSTDQNNTYASPHKPIIRDLKKCCGDLSSLVSCDMNSQDQLINRQNEIFPVSDVVQESPEKQHIEETQEFVDQLDPRILKKYIKHKERNPFEDPYYVVLTPLHGLERLKYELKNYNDHLNFLQLRKTIVYAFLCVPMHFQKIVDSFTFKLINGFLIICNLIFFTLSNSYPPVVNEQYKQFIIYCFAIEIAIRLIAAGGIFPTVQFLNSKEDIFNFLCALTSFLHYFYYNYIQFDPTPLRIITILLYLGDGLMRLKYMLIALKKSLVFLTEALFILIILALFFSIIGVSLFQGLFNFRCQPLNQDEQNGTWVQCYENLCPEGMVCTISEETPKIPTSFNNIFFSIGQILRTITMDDWSWVMFYTMRIFHPWVWIYYLAIIFICGFFSINLMIAVLKIHYSEATVECEQFERLSKQKQEDLNLKRQEIFLSMDVISYFDISFLRYIGFYNVLKRHKILTNTNLPLKELLDTNFQPEKSGNQIRLLSSKQKKILDEALQKNSNRSIWDKFKNFSLKKLLLPKFSELQAYQKQINIKIFSDDPIEISILLKLTGYSFLQLTNSVNYKIDQKYKSLRDVFVQKKSIRHKDKIKMFYQTYQHKKEQKVPIRQTSDVSLSRYPIHKSTRRITIQKTNSRQEDSLCDNSPQFRRRRTDLFTTINIRTRHEKKFPFERTKGGRLYLYIQGYYLDYEQISDKINIKIPKQKSSMDYNNEEIYQLIFQKEREQKIIKSQNWSGNNVLQLDPIRMEQFEEIFRNLNNVKPLIWMPTIGGKLLILRKYTLIILDNKISQLFFDLVILINFIFLSLYGIVDSYIISKCEDISTVFLLVEIGLQMFTYPLKRFFSSKGNILQAIIMIASFIEFSFSDYLNLSEQYLRMIRGTKCILFFRCLKYNQMAVLIGKIASITFKQYIYLTIFMFIMITIYAMIGQDLYAGKLDQNDSLGQLHSFDNILKAGMTVFNIMTNDDWYGVYVIGTGLNMDAATIYSFSMVIILNYLTYGLVLAILLDGFGKYLDVKDEDSHEQQFLPSQTIKDEDPINTEIDSMQDFKLKGSNCQSVVNLIEQQVDENGAKMKLDMIEILQKFLKQLYKQLQKRNPRLYEDVECETSLYIFDKKSRFRRFCSRIISFKLFSWFSNVVLVASIFVMIVRTYHDFETDRSDYPYAILTILNVLMLGEDLICIIAKGMFLDKGSHLNYTWQYVDLIYELGFFINIYKENPVINICVFLGHFRPMKLMYRIKWLDSIRAALAQSLFDMVKLLLTLVSVWIMFGVFGIIMYESQFGFCNDKMQFNVNQQECIQKNGDWINYKHNFDNITIALPTLFIVSTFDGWGEIMQVAENSRQSQYGPAPFENYLSTYFYFISFCFIGSMFFLSFFTGTLFSKLRSNQQKIEMDDLTKNQREFIELCPIILRDVPVFSNPPSGFMRGFASFIVNSSFCQKLMFLVLLIDLVCQLQYQYQMERSYLRNINLIQRVLILFYFIWIMLLFLSLGVNRFFDNLWRRYYTILIIISIIDLFVDIQYDWVIVYFESTVYTPHYRLLRLAFMTRQLRLLVIFQGLTNLARLIRVMGFALPFLAKLISILIITMIIYALIGCQLFGKITSGAVIDDLINFTNFEYALLALFKCASGDDFRTIMTDTMHHNPDCPENPDCCGSDYNQIYFISFMLFSNYVLLNLFILGLIEQFEEFFQLQNSMIQTYVEQIDNIKNAWCRYSADTKGKSMHYKFLCRFLLDIGQPLGGGKDDNLWDAAKLASKLNLRCDPYGYIQYNQLLYQLFRRCYHEEVFKDGPQMSLEKIKSFNKEMQIRLLYYRRNKTQYRSAISSQRLQFKSNFNILHDYLNVLILFKTWQSYSNLLVQKIMRRQDDYTENDEMTIDGILDNNPQYWQQVQNDFIDGFSSRRRTTDIKLQDEFTGHHVSRQSQEVQQDPQIPIYQTTLQQETDRIFGGFDENVVLDCKDQKIKIH